jgi:DNA polymerase-3 subunit delta
MACLAYPFLASRRLIIVTGLVGRLQPKDRSRGQVDRRPQRAVKVLQQEETEFCTVLLEVPSHTDLVLLERQPWRTNTPIFKTLSDVKAKIFNPLSSRDSASWIMQRVKHKGGMMTPALAQRLANRVGQEFAGIENDLEKLIVYSGGNDITWDAIECLIADSHEAKIFTLIDQSISGNARSALLEMGRLINDGVSPAYMLLMMTRQIRLLLLFKERVGRGVRPATAASELGIPEFLMDKTSRQASKYSMQQLDTIYSALVSIDLDAKTSRIDLETSLILFVASLATQHTASHINS